MAGYSFTNLCGVPYSGGRVCFSSDGNSLLSLVGNRVSVADLLGGKVNALLPENTFDNRHIALSPDGRILLVVDVEGHVLVINYASGIVLNELTLKGKVSEIVFSPNSAYVAVALDRKLQVWEAPTLKTGWQFTKIMDRRVHMGKINSIDWSSDSSWICTTSKDMTVRLIAATPKIACHCPNWKKPRKQSKLAADGSPVHKQVAFVTLVDHRSPVRGAFFSDNMNNVFSVSSDGVIVTWKWESANSIEKEEACSVNGQESRKRSRSLTMSTSGDHSTAIARNDKCRCQRCGRWSFLSKAYCQHSKSHGTKVSRCAFHRAKGLLVIGFVNGVFCLYECPEMQALYTLSIGGGVQKHVMDGMGLSASSAIDTIAINSDGEWIAVGAAELGQLVVWEWKSETFILREQGHHFGVRAVAFAPTGGKLFDVGGSRRDRLGRVGTSAQSHSHLGLSSRCVAATGGYDGKVKIWDTSSGFCFVTFTDHTAPVEAITFTSSGNAVVSASTDGSVRAFDRLRYRNFRTFASPHAGVQFVSVAVENGGDIVAAGCTGASYQVVLWSMQTGSVLELLSGHEAPVVGIQFHPHPSKAGVLASASWDNTIRIWDIFSRKGHFVESLEHTSMVLSMSFDPRGNGRLAAATTSGKIAIWNSDDAELIGTIDGLRDIRSGRIAGQQFSANNQRGKHRKGDFGPNDGVNKQQHFSSVTYNTTGQWLLCCSKTSPRVCIYDADMLVLIHSVQLTHSYSLTGIRMELNSRYMTEGGVGEGQLAVSDSDDDDNLPGASKRRRIQEAGALPGAKIGEFSSAAGRSQFVVWQGAISADGRRWGAATSHGLYLYSIDARGAHQSRSSGSASISKLTNFAPVLLTPEATVTNVLSAVSSGRWTEGLRVALYLNDFALIRLVYESTPYSTVPLVVQSVPLVLLPVLLNFLRVSLMHPPTAGSVSSATALRKPNPDTKNATTVLLRSRAGQNYIQGGVHGSPHLQFHMAWLLNILSANAASLQGYELGGKVTRGEKEAAASKHLRLRSHDSRGSSSLEVDMRMLCLLLLRELQRISSNMTKLLETNCQTLSYLCASARRHHT